MNASKHIIHAAQQLSILKMLLHAGDSPVLVYDLYSECLKVMQPANALNNVGKGNARMVQHSPFLIEKLLVADLRDALVSINNS